MNEYHVDEKQEQQPTTNTKITKQKEYEFRLGNILKNINENERLREEFSSMITHELKTPITPIKGYCEILKEGMYGKLNREQFEFVDIIESNAIQLENLIEDILDVQKLKMNQMKFFKKEIPTERIFKNVENSFKPLLSKRKATLKREALDSYTIYTDETRIKQVFYNLIRNSLDFIPEKNGIIEIGLIPNNENIVFFVKDNGKGISKEKQFQVFKKFYQENDPSTRKYGGTGLGLVICKGIVENLGGKIWFESEVNKGTTFYFSVERSASKK